jgi:hypothetical protein
VDAVGAEDEPLVGLQLSRAKDVHQDFGLRPDASRQDVSVGGSPRLGGCYLAGGHPRSDDRVIVGDLSGLAARDDVGSRVADVGDADHALWLGHQGDDQR